MKITLSAPNVSAKTYMRECSYIEITSYHTGETSYARALEHDRHYPRFHVYIEMTPASISINLHLDAKETSYDGVAAHSGEYDGKLVEEEIARIQDIIGNLSKKMLPKKLGF